MRLGVDFEDLRIDFELAYLLLWQEWPAGTVGEGCSGVLCDPLEMGAGREGRLQQVVYVELG